MGRKNKVLPTLSASEKIIRKYGFDKYELYINSVQAPDVDVQFFHDTYKKVRGKKAHLLREDFCGTHAMSCEWVKLDKKNQAIGIDLDPEPIAYGIEKYQPLLTDDQRSRVEIYKKNVLDKSLPKADIINALNFSYFIFKERKTLLKYFKNARKGLKKNGLFIIDCFGGSACMEPNEEETDHGEFSYFWDQDSYDPVSNNAQFYIHFKPKGKKKVEAFSYDWRMWSIPELKDLLEEAGFSKVSVYWEGTTKDGEGDGNFQPVEQGEDCDSWVSYLISEK